MLCRRASLIKELIKTVVQFYNYQSIQHVSGSFLVRQVWIVILSPQQRPIHSERLRRRLFLYLGKGDNQSGEDPAGRRVYSQLSAATPQLLLPGYQRHRPCGPIMEPQTRGEQLMLVCEVFCLFVKLQGFHSLGQCSVFVRGSYGIISVFSFFFFVIWIKLMLYCI